MVKKKFAGLTGLKVICKCPSVYAFEPDIQHF